MGWARAKKLWLGPRIGRHSQIGGVLLWQERIAGPAKRDERIGDGLGVGGVEGCSRVHFIQEGSIALEVFCLCDLAAVHDWYSPCGGHTLGGLEVDIPGPAFGWGGNFRGQLAVAGQQKDCANLAFGGLGEEGVQVFRVVGDGHPSGTTGGIGGDPVDFFRCAGADDGVQHLHSTAVFHPESAFGWGRRTIGWRWGFDLARVVIAGVVWRDGGVGLVVEIAVRPEVADHQELGCHRPAKGAHLIQGLCGGVAGHSGGQDIYMVVAALQGRVESDVQGVCIGQAMSEDAGIPGGENVMRCSGAGNLTQPVGTQAKGHPSGGGLVLKGPPAGGVCVECGGLAMVWRRPEKPCSTLQEQQKAEGDSQRKEHFFLK